MAYERLSFEQIWSRVKPRDGYIHALTYSYIFMFADDQCIEPVLFALQNAGYEILDVKIAASGSNTGAVNILYK